MMEIKKAVVGSLDTNCYVLVKENKCLVIDPGDEIDKIKALIKDNEVVGVIVTHYHFDHIGALKYFAKDLVYDFSNLKEQVYNIGPFTFEVIYTKGHKEDAITLFFKKEQVMFTGDFIFKGTIGRMDLPGGSIREMKESLNKIKTYPDCTIYPGHGKPTTLKAELTNLAKTGFVKMDKM